MNAIYRKYRERGGKPVFHPKHPEAYGAILDELSEIAGSADYVRDMRIQERLSALLVLLMEDAWDVKKRTHAGTAALDVQQVKEYLDENFREKITLDELAARFFINKYYLISLFRERYGMTVNAYLNQVRVNVCEGAASFYGPDGGGAGRGAADRAVLAEQAVSEGGGRKPGRIPEKLEGISPAGLRKSWRA